MLVFFKDLAKIMVAAISKHVINLHQGEGAAEDERFRHVGFHGVDIIREGHAHLFVETFG